MQCNHVYIICFSEQFYGTKQLEFQGTLTFVGKSNFEKGYHVKKLTIYILKYIYLIISLIDCLICNKQIRRRGGETEIENGACLINLIETKNNYQGKSSFNLSARKVCLTPL